LIEEGDILLAPKADILDVEIPGVSGLTGQGVDEVIERIGEILSDRAQGAGAAIRLRHETAIKTGLACLEQALVHMASGDDMTDLAAEEVHSAIRALDSLVGRVDIESVLDDIFSSFCIGK